MSRCLRDRGLPHLVLERGQVAQRWRCERWHSFTLLSPNWQTRLPGHRYTGFKTDGFMRAAKVADMLQAYAKPRVVTRSRFRWMRRTVPLPRASTSSTSSRSWTPSRVPPARNSSSATKMCKCSTVSRPPRTRRRTWPASCSPTTWSADSLHC